MCLSNLISRCTEKLPSVKGKSFLYNPYTTLELLQLETQLLGETLDQGAHGNIPATAEMDIQLLHVFNDVFIAQKMLLQTEVPFKRGHLEKLCKLILERIQGNFYLTREMIFR